MGAWEGALRRRVSRMSERFVAVDWSGKAKGAAEFIWVAEVVDGRLTQLRNGWTRPAVVEHLRSLARPDERVVVGLDFAFSLPAWWLEERGLADAPALWEHLAAGEAERILQAGETPPPFWGRPGSRKAVALAGREALRETEGGSRAKSVFQIGGAGAVGTGSLRGMALLPQLAEAYAIWPWAVGPRVALEIYPRAFTGPVNKSSWAERHRWLFARHERQQPHDLLERAAGSEDAFDAAASALAMAAGREELRALTAQPRWRREGSIWPPATPPGPPPAPA
jgi:hypothetical protein